MNGLGIIGIGLLALWYLSRSHDAAAAPGVSSGAAATGTTPTTTGGELHTNMPTIDGGPVYQVGEVIDPVSTSMFGGNAWDPAASANQFADWVWSIPVGDPGAGTPGRDPRFVPGVVDASQL